jgi:hypothetical protein
MESSPQRQQQQGHSLCCQTHVSVILRFHILRLCWTKLIIFPSSRSLLFWFQSTCSPHLTENPQFGFEIGRFLAPMPCQPGLIEHHLTRFVVIRVFCLLDALPARANWVSSAQVCDQFSHLLNCTRKADVSQQIFRAEPDELLAIVDELHPPRVPGVEVPWARLCFTLSPLVETPPIQEG